MRWLNNLLFLIVVGIAVFLNIYVLFNQSIRLDESVAIWLATKPIDVILKTNLQNTHIPLYLVLLHFWIQLVGTNIYFVRMFSLILFLLNLPALYYFGRIVSKNEVGLLSVILYSYSPFIIWYGNEAWAYPMLTLMALLNNIFFLIFYHSNGSRGKLGYFITTVLGLFTNYFFTLIIFSQFAYLLIRSRTSKTLLFKQILLLAAPLGFFVFWLSISNISDNVSLSVKPILSRLNSYNLIQAFVNFLFGFPKQEIQAFIVSFWPLFTTVILFVFTRKKTVKLIPSGYFLTTTSIPILIIFLISTLQPLALARELIFITPSIFLLIAWLLTSYNNRLNAPLTILIVVVMLSMSLYQIKSQTSPLVEDYKDVTLFITKNATPYDIIAVTPPYTIFPVEYYFNRLIRIVTVPEWNNLEDAPIPKFNPNISGKDIQNYRLTYSRIFIIYSFSQGGDVYKVNDYFLHHFERIGKKVFHSNIEVDVYRFRYDVPLPRSS